MRNLSPDSVGVLQQEHAGLPREAIASTRYVDVNRQVAAPCISAELSAQVGRRESEYI